MKIIFSRKGFDSSSGGTPSPIFPDDRIMSLPIPDSRVTTSYDDINHPEIDYGSLVEQLTKNKISRFDGVHLDPDLDPKLLPRPAQWRPLFGQYGAAQAHLKNQGVAPGDIFLYFGLFRRVKYAKGLVSWRKDEKPMHLFWGYQQIDRIIDLNELDLRGFPWLNYHAHCQFQAKHNTLYVATKTLALEGQTLALPGAGVFSYFSDDLRLTAPEAGRVSQWRLPSWLFPSQGKTPLSYHGDMTRWQRKPTYTALNAVARGQEFVLDATQYPESIAWLSKLLVTGMDTTG